LSAAGADSLDVVQIVIVVGLSGDKTASPPGAAVVVSAGVVVVSVVAGAVVAGSVVAGAVAVDGVVVVPDVESPPPVQAAIANTKTLASSNAMTFLKIICIPPYIIASIGLTPIIIPT
jgi:hypothetical protein